MYTVRITDDDGGEIETYPVKGIEVAMVFARRLRDRTDKAARTQRAGGHLTIRVIDKDGDVPVAYM